MRQRVTTSIGLVLGAISDGNYIELLSDVKVASSTRSTNFQAVFLSVGCIGERHRIRGLARSSPLFPPS